MESHATVERFPPAVMSVMTPHLLRLTVCLALSVLLHLSLLLDFRQHSAVASDGRFPAWIKPGSAQASFHSRRQAAPTGISLHVPGTPPIAAARSPSEALEPAPAEIPFSLGEASPEPPGGGAGPTPAPSDEQDNPLAGGYFYPMSELTRKPLILADVSPQFPALPENGPRVRVVLTLLIEEDGRVIGVIVQQVQAPDAFREAVIKAFRSARFEPGEIEQIPVRSQLNIEIGDDAANSQMPSVSPLRQMPQMEGATFNSGIK